jgi:hypothetical protein
MIDPITGIVSLITAIVSLVGRLSRTLPLFTLGKWQ